MTMLRTMPPASAPATRRPAPRAPAPAPAPQLPEPEDISSPREPNLRARFVPLAESRTSAVIAALDYLGQLSQRARYRYTDEEIAAIETAIFDKLSETIEAFRRGTGNKPGFSFRGVAQQEDE